MVILFVLLFLLVFSAFSEIAFASVRVDITKTYPETVQPKCGKPATEYLKDAESYYKMRGNMSYAITAYPTKAVAAALLYQICSQLEQNK